MKKFTKALAALMLTVAVFCAAGCTKPDDPNDPNNGGNNGGNGGGNGSGGNGGSLPAGMYLGVIGFNQQLYTRPITRLDAATIQQTKDFIDGLEMGGATLLYHAVNTSLDMLASNGIPQDLINVSIVNFTDGLVDVLQTGADDLVLADMNEESANYLALQTRNNLAVNALALAAQSNNAVLKLF